MQAARLTRLFRERLPDTELTLHSHNTRGMGLANVLASIGAGRLRADPRARAGPSARRLTGDIEETSAAASAGMAGVPCQTCIRLPPSLVRLAQCRHSQAAPRTPDESPCWLGRMRVRSGSRVNAGPLPG